VHTEKVLELARHALLLATAIACAYTDVARGRIYNAVTLPALFLGFALSIIWDGLAVGSPNLKGSALALVAGGGLFGLVYLMRGMGAGDVKLMAAIGAICAEWRFALLAAFYSALVGAVIGAGYLVWRGRLGGGLKRSLRLLVSFGRKPGTTGLTLEETFPYGLAIAAGTMWAWVEMNHVLAVARAAS
jgi:prepilin peptidase CpaA